MLELAKEREEHGDGLEEEKEEEQTEEQKRSRVESCCPSCTFFIVSNVFLMQLSRVRSRLVWVLEVKVVNQLRYMSKLISQQPGCFFVCTFVSGPMDEVQEFTVLVSMVDLQIEDLFDLVFSFTIYIDQRRQNFHMIGDCVRCCRF